MDVAPDEARDARTRYAGCFGVIDRLWCEADDLPSRAASKAPNAIFGGVEGVELTTASRDHMARRLDNCPGKMPCMDLRMQSASGQQIRR
jgi:hypothetical protein